MPHVATIECEDAISFCVDAVWGFAEIDPNGKWVWLNPAFCKILDAPPDLVIGTTFRDWTHPDDVEIDASMKQQVKNGEIPSFTLAKRYVQRGNTPKNPRHVWGQLSVSGKWSKTGEFLGYRIQFRPYENISSLHKLDTKQIVSWVLTNWKPVTTVLVILTSLIFGGSEKLLTILQKAQETKDSVEQVLQPSSSGASSAPTLP